MTVNTSYKSTMNANIAMSGSEAITTTPSTAWREAGAGRRSVSAMQRRDSSGRPLILTAMALLVCGFVIHRAEALCATCSYTSSMSPSSSVSPYTYSKLFSLTFNLHRRELNLPDPAVMYTDSSTQAEVLERLLALLNITRPVIAPKGTSTSTSRRRWSSSPLEALSCSDCDARDVIPQNLIRIEARGDGDSSRRMAPASVFRIYRSSSLQPQHQLSASPSASRRTAASSYGKETFSVDRDLMYIKVAAAELLREGAADEAVDLLLSTVAKYEALAAHALAPASSSSSYSSSSPAAFYRASADALTSAVDILLMPQRSVSLGRDAMMAALHSAQAALLMLDRATTATGPTSESDIARMYVLGSAAVAMAKRGDSPLVALEMASGVLAGLAESVAVGSSSHSYSMHALDSRQRLAAVLVDIGEFYLTWQSAAVSSSSFDGDQVRRLLGLGKALCEGVYLPGPAATLRRATSALSSLGDDCVFSDVDISNDASTAEASPSYENPTFDRFLHVFFLLGLVAVGLPVAFNRRKLGGIDDLQVSECVGVNSSSNGVPSMDGAHDACVDESPKLVAADDDKRCSSSLYSVSVSGEQDQGNNSSTNDATIAVQTSPPTTALAKTAAAITTPAAGLAREPVSPIGRLHSKMDIVEDDSLAKQKQAQVEVLVKEEEKEESLRTEVSTKAKDECGGSSGVEHLALGLLRDFEFDDAERYITSSLSNLGCIDELIASGDADLPIETVVTVCRLKYLLSKAQMGLGKYGEAERNVYDVVDAVIKFHVLDEFCLAAVIDYSMMICGDVLFDSLGQETFMPDRLIKARDLIYEMVFSEGDPAPKCLAQQKFQLRLPRSHAAEAFTAQLPMSPGSPTRRGTPARATDAVNASRTMMDGSWISVNSNVDDSLFLVDDYKSLLRQRIAKSSNSSSDRILRALEALLNNFGNDKVNQKSVASDVEDLAREMDLVFEDISGYERNAQQQQRHLDMNQSQFLREADGAFAEAMSPKRSAPVSDCASSTLSFLQLSPEPLVNDARSPHVMFTGAREEGSPSLSTSEFDGDTFDDLLFEGPNNISMRLGMSGVKPFSTMQHFNEAASPSHDGIASVVRGNIFADVPSSKENGSEMASPAASKQVDARERPVPEQQQQGRKRKQFPTTPSSPLAPASPSPPRRTNTAAVTAVVVSPTSSRGGAMSGRSGAGGVRVMR